MQTITPLLQDPGSTPTGNGHQAPPDSDPPAATIGTPPPPLLRLADLMDAWDAEAEALYQAKQTGQALGPITGLPKLDRELASRMMPGQHTIHGAPGTGKTAFCLQVAASCGCPALYVTAEMAPLELLRRITARITNTYLGKFKTGELHPKEAARLVRQAAKAAPDMAIMDATQGYASPADILSAAEATRTLAPTGHLLIVVDSVHSWAEGAPGGEEYDRLNAHLAALRKLAARLSCPILTVAERNRANSSGGLSAAAGSRKFEYGGESVFDLASKEDSTDDANGERPITLKLAKNRHGTPGKRIELRFHGALQSFREA